MIPPIAPIPGVLPALLTAINDRFRALGNSGSTAASATQASASTSPGGTLIGTHPARLLAKVGNLPAGVVWVESERKLAYVLNAQGSWIYVAGVMSGTLASKPSDLGANDAGALFHATDYVRVFEWSGTVWQRAPGERPTREFCYFAESPGTGWHLCDGTAAVAYTKSDASTGTMTMPSESAGVYRKSGAAYAGSTIAATVPTISGATAAPTGTTTVQSGTGATVASSTHTHAQGTLALSGAGEPANVVMLPYMKL